MNKQELIAALSSPVSMPRTTASLAHKPEPQLAAARNTNGSATAEEQVERSKYDVGVPTKDLSAKVPKDLPAGYGKDRIVCMVRDPYWLHCYWELTSKGIAAGRGRPGPGLARRQTDPAPARRLQPATSPAPPKPSSATSTFTAASATGTSTSPIRPVPSASTSAICPAAANFTPWPVPTSSATPRAGMSDVIDENWADIDSGKADRIYAMSAGFDPTASSLELKQLFEERLRRPMGSPAVTSFGSGAFQYGKERKFWFQLDAELIVYGATEPNAKVTLQGEPVKLRNDGTFTMRFSLPDNRQIIPAVATSADGIEERTIVLAVERNTKHLEPVVHENE